ncbi:hypothetical protein H6F76_23500 [Leptolyngbya sp. FACHB-321]|uniref:DUF3298 and DUF4163 domain-containing protein n=1 Tax=Leptolyngbya sp. FACHB-321 TaxID=2692807 RepID=UPI001683097A|nr:DUF3298 and DUF4163 domain-containing protein [Leptolyngbya sp. FACHB-321]MBD2037921.1 hypothetical protein [Leptolyngbya sp. FACHB-321]
MKISLLVGLFAGCSVLMASVPLKAHELSSPKASVVRLGDGAIDRSNRLSLSPKPPQGDRVLVETKTVTFVRGKKGQEYPDYKEAIVKYPQVTGLTNPAVLRNVQSAVSLKSVLGQSIAELRAEFLASWWLSEIDYTVNYNQNSLLDLTFTRSGSGAYPSSSNKHRLVNLKTGKVVKAADVFKRESLSTIAAMVNKAMQAEVKQAIANGDKEGADLREQLKNQRFQTKHLDSFTISDKGITFLYDFGFPHVILALQPSGKYFLSHNQLRAHIKPDGALNVFLPNTTAGKR